MLTVFPASYSTLSTDALATLISDKYELAGVQCTLLLRGVGDTYLVVTRDNKFILRVYRNSHRNLAQVRMETDLLLALKEAGVSVAYPVPDTAGEVIQTLEGVEGSRQAVLFIYAPGRVVRMLDKQQLHVLGSQMARMHNVSSAISLENTRWTFDADTTLLRPLELLKHSFREDPEGYRWMQEAAREVERKFSQMDTTGFSTGYCHFDFLPKNFHFEGNSLTFFDFDFMGYGWLVNDIMTYWQHLCLDVHFGKMKQQEADEAYAAFLQAYRAIRPVSDAELSTVPYLSLGFWLFYMGFHTTHDQFYPFVEPWHLKLRVDMIRQLMERYWISGATER